MGVRWDFHVTSIGNKQERERGHGDTALSHGGLSGLLMDLMGYDLGVVHKLGYQKNHDL